ncbi:MAG: DUF4332 domain-containing protein, partial [Pseudomonadota bacterium]
PAKRTDRRPIASHVHSMCTGSSSSSQLSEPPDATPIYNAPMSTGLDGNLAEVFHEAARRSADIDRGMATADDLITALAHMISVASDLADIGIDATTLRRSLKAEPEDAVTSGQQQSAAALVSLAEIEDALRLAAATNGQRATVTDLIAFLAGLDPATPKLRLFQAMAQGAASAPAEHGRNANHRARAADARTQCAASSVSDATSQLATSQRATSQRATSQDDTRHRTAGPMAPIRLRQVPSRTRTDDRVDSLANDLGALCDHVARLAVELQNAPPRAQTHSHAALEERFDAFTRQMQRDMRTLTQSLTLLGDRVSDLEQRARRSGDRASTHASAAERETARAATAPRDEGGSREEWLPDALPLIPRHLRRTHRAETTEQNAERDAGSDRDTSCETTATPRQRSTRRTGQRARTLRRRRDRFRARAGAWADRRASQRAERATSRRRVSAQTAVAHQAIRTRAATENGDADDTIAFDAEPRFYLAMKDPVVDAPSIGPRTAWRLENVGIHTVRDLLEADVERAVEQIDVRHITVAAVNAWQDQARLVLTVPWLRGTHAQLLVGAGFTDATALQQADTADVMAAVLRFAGTRDGQRILRDGPAPAQEKIESWVSHAHEARLDRAA